MISHSLNRLLKQLMDGVFFPSHAIKRRIFWQTDMCESYLGEASHMNTYILYTHTWKLNVVLWLAAATSNITTT